MDMTSQPPDGDSQDEMRTQEIAQPWNQTTQDWQQPAGQPWHPPTQDSQQPAGQPWHPPTSPSGPPPGRSPRRRLRWAAGLAVVAVLIGGAAYAVAQLAAAAPTGPTGQAAQLNTILNDASSPGSAAAASTFGQTLAATPSATTDPCIARAAKILAAGHPAKARLALRLCRHPQQRLRLVGGEYGEFTFRTKNGTSTLAYERGVVASVSGSNVVVTAADGTTRTWVLGSSTVVRGSGKVVSASTLSAGEHVFAGGHVVSGAYDARLIVIQPASSGS